MKEKIWNADGTWNIMRKTTHTICHKPMCPISSDMQSPVSSRLCGSYGWFRESIWFFVRFDNDVALPIIQALFNDFSSYLFVTLVTHAVFLFFTKFSRKLNTLFQKLFFGVFLPESLLESDNAISIFELFNVSGVSIVPDVANNTFCRKFSPDTLFFDSEFIFRSKFEWSERKKYGQF